MSDRRPAVPDVKLYELLDSLDATGMKLITGTGYITCTTSLIDHLRFEVFDYEGVWFPDYNALYDAFWGQPVKQVWAVCRSYLRSRDPGDWLRAVRRRAEKRREENEDEAEDPTPIASRIR